jgi:hypothetical protein
MTTGFGFCPQCGTPRIAAEQRFCAGCGTDLAAIVVPPPTPPVAAALPTPLPVAAPPAPAAAVPSQPPTPPAWSVAPAQSYPAAYTAPGAPGVPAAPAAPAAPIATVAGIKVTPKLLAIGGIALAVVVGAYLFMSMNSKPGSISVTPASFSCSAQNQVTSVIKLPSSLKATDQIAWQLDGVPVITTKVSDQFKLQSDGSWLFTDTSSASSSCTGPGGGPLTMGAHTMRILDASGKVLAEGSYTVTP